MSKPALKEQIRIAAMAAFLGLVQPSTYADSGADVCNVAERRANLDFTLQDVTGREVALADYEGHVILLDFWATWCAPCRVEIPGLVELYEKYRERGFVVLGVSVDDPVSRLTPYVADLDMTYPVLIGEGRYDVREAFGPLTGFPTSFLISRDGTICVRHVGIASKERHEQEINALL